MQGLASDTASPINTRASGSYTTVESPIRLTPCRILPLSIHCLVILLVLARYLSNRQSVKQTRGPSLLSIFVWDHTWVFVAVLGNYIVSPISATGPQMLPSYLYLVNRSVADTWR